SHFENLLVHSKLPEPGPAYFYARRDLWLSPQPKYSRAPSSLPRPKNPQLQSYLEGPVEILCKDSMWQGGLGKLCERILNREVLANRLPLRHLVKLLQASWMVDDLWPKGQAAPSSDED
ncbi:hypothetical protein BC835DRAFT_1207529, partial [Cytidiella melzeri]